MCADDVVCSGAEPVAFLDYVAVGRLDPTNVAELVGGVADGCRQAGCALVGGETAEHPGLMEADEFDLAGFCIGIAERSRLLDGTAARAGDAIVGLASSGLHANGYSLVRSLVAEHDLDLARAVPGAAARVAGRRRGGRRCSRRSRSTRRDARRGAPRRRRAIYARDVLAIREALWRPGATSAAMAHITGGGLPGNVPRALPEHLGARLDPSAWPMPSVMRLLGALGGIEDDELRATFNGGLGMVVVVPAAVAPTRPSELARDRGVAGVGRGRGRRRPRRRGAPVRGGGRVSAAGSPSGCPGRARTCGRSSRPRSAASSAARSCSCSRTARARRSTGRRSRGSRRSSCRAATTPTSRTTLAAGRARRRRPRGLPAARRPGGAAPRFAGRILNVHPSLLPAFPGAPRRPRRARGRRRRHRRHRPPRRRDARRRPDRGPGGGRRCSRTTTRPRCSSGSTRWSTGCCRAAVAASLAGALAVRPAPAARASIPRSSTRARPCRAGRCSRSPTRRASSTSARGLVARGFELVEHRRHGAGAARGRAPGDRRRRRDRLPRDARRPRQDAPPAGPRAACSRTAAAPTTARRSPRPASPRSSSSWSTSTRSRRPPRRPGIAFDELVEEIDIGGPSMVRAAAKNHAIGRDRDVAGALRRGPGGARRARRGAPRPALRARRRGVPAHRRLRRPDRGRAAVPDARRGRRPARRSPGCPAPPTRIRRCSTISHGQGRDAALRREPAPAGRALPPHGPRAARRRRARSPAASRRSRARRSATTTCSTRPRRPALARLLRGPGVVIVKHTNPCGAAERGDAPRGLGRGARGRPGVGVRRRRRRHGDGRRAARRAAGLDLPRGRRRARRSTTARARSSRPSPTCASSWTRRSTRRRTARGAPGAACRLDWLGSLRTAGGAVLVTAPDTQPDDPAAWATVSRRPPTDEERRDLDLAWRLCRGVVSNAIVLVRDGDARRPRIGPGEPRGRLPSGRREGGDVPGRARGDGCRGRLRRVLPVRRRAGPAARRRA